MEKARRVHRGGRGSKGKKRQGDEQDEREAESRSLTDTEKKEDERIVSGSKQ